jgi:glycosyltransferase involved in cell wall biosynthesis
MNAQALGLGRLRVLFVPDWYPRLETAGTVSGTFVREHVLSAARYNEVAVLDFILRPALCPGLALDVEDDLSIPTYRARAGYWPHTLTGDFVKQLFLARALRHVIRTWGRPDLLHLQDNLAFDVLRAARKMHIPCVVSQHCSVFTKRQLTPQWHRRFRYTFSKAARVLPAKYSASADYDHYDLKANITWLPNAFDPTLFYPPTTGFRKPRLLHVSGFAPEKRVFDTIRAFAQVVRARPEARLHLVGEGAARHALAELAGSLLPKGTCQFLGFLPKPAVAEEMRAACGFIFPSEHETFGCVLMEALACGCPVLTTNAGGIPAVADNTNAIIVPIGDIDAITAGMVRLIDGTHGLDTARIAEETKMKFSRQAVGRKLQQIYQEALCEPK